MEKIIILDFGSQVTQLIGRRIREIGVYCEIYPFNKIPVIDSSVKGVILSGSPFSVREEQAPQISLEGIKGVLPVLGICYGSQLMAHNFGGSVERSDSREYGRAHLRIIDKDCPLLKDIPEESVIWMSHGDTITSLPKNSHIIASTPDVAAAAYRFNDELTFATQFHPEVYHTEYGSQILKNFVCDICGCAPVWTADSFVESSVASLREKLGNDKVILGLSGGVDSTVAAVLLHKAIGHNLICIFVDNGLLRLNEAEEVMASYRGMGLNVTCVDAGDKFLAALAGKTDPEDKRKAVGKTFIDVFEAEALKHTGARWLGQGTIYPDVIESAAVGTGSAKIKSHHNVGGLPEKMNLKIVEPLRDLFKDEVRRVGRSLGIPQRLIGRHPFPGPSLCIRVIGEVTKDKLDILRAADDVFIRNLREWPCNLPCASEPSRTATNLYDAIWQAGTIILPVRSVGVMGDERTYDYTIALRAVTSTDGMTADWFHLPYEFMEKISNEIINHVKGVNRVCYDISSKPPATIEWE
ncbi:MAG: glutamine-hydrolyzing GMP synthase [Bacteroidales bacterium]|nr:glutamine-hydrolyzing GMP synthase [Bacteroidales bacterium]